MNLLDGLAAVFSASVLEVSGIYEVSVVSRFYGVCGMFRVSRISSVSRCLEFLEYQHIAFQNCTETSSNNVNTFFSVILCIIIAIKSIQKTKTYKYF